MVQDLRHNLSLVYAERRYSLTTRSRGKPLDKLTVDFSEIFTHRVYCERLIFNMDAVFLCAYMCSVELVRRRLVLRTKPVSFTRATESFSETPGNKTHVKQTCLLNLNGLLQGAHALRG